MALECLDKPVSHVFLDVSQGSARAFLYRVWWAGMQVRAGRVVPNGNQNAKSVFIEWDKDCAELGVRTRGARRSWIVQWRVAGRTRKKTLGRVEEITRSKARQLAVALLGAPKALEVERSNSPMIRVFVDR